MKMPWWISFTCNMDKLLYHIALVFTVLSLGSVVAGTLECEFPDSWHGNWHQANLGQVHVTRNTISRKGTCIEHFRSYYVMQNTEDNCVLCMLMLEQHANIIQYKESYCTKTNNLRSVCDNIRVEATMYTLVKEPTNTIPCPFPDNYRVTYDEMYHGHYGPCSTTNSYLNSCNGGERGMTFHFEHCSPAAYWNGHDLQFECLATWKEGSDDFLYGRFTGNVIARKDASYRCFKYDARGSVIQLAMSADATCRGLVSPELGPVVMRLAKDISNEPEAGCEYPSWLTSSRWQDYSGDIRVNFHGHRHKLSIQSSSGHERLLCQDKLQLDVNEYVVAAYSAKNCGTNYQCLYFKRLNDRAFTLQRGDEVTSYVDSYRCRANQHLVNHSPAVFISSRALNEPIGCPNPGMYSFEQPATHCDMHIHAGCASITSVLVQPQCNFVSRTVLECVTYWLEGNTTYWVVKDMNSAQLHCVGMEERGDNLYRMQICSNSASIPASLHNVDIMRHGSCQARIPTRKTTQRPNVPTRIPNTDNNHPPDKDSSGSMNQHTNKNNAVTNDNQRVPVPTTRATWTYKTVTSTKEKHLNNDEDTESSHQYSNGASGFTCQYSLVTSFANLLFMATMLVGGIQPT